MTREAHSLRYIDIFLESFEKGNAESLAAFGTHVHWGYWKSPTAADGSTADFVSAAEEMARRVTEAARIEDGHSVLDAGCGFGGTLASINSRFASMNLVGVNIDARQVKRACSTVTARSANQIAFLHADALSIPVESGRFDAVLSVESICHFRSRKTFFREAHRILKPFGRLVVVDFVPAPVLKPWIVVTDALFGKINEAVYGPMNIRCTLDGYRMLAAQNGYTIEREEDVTVNTVPSYAYTRRLMSDFRRPRLETLANNSINSNMEWLSRQGVLRYMILTFRKEETAVA